MIDLLQIYDTAYPDKSVYVLYDFNSKCRSRACRKITDFKDYDTLELFSDEKYLSSLIGTMGYRSLAKIQSVYEQLEITYPEVLI